uniref:Uncharacterized protein n=1 Tax=Leersia perrieri TaxID=77586 RepID=A0A0D9X6F7_9ORYZ
MDRIDVTYAHQHQLERARFAIAVRVAGGTQHRAEYTPAVVAESCREGDTEPAAGDGITHDGEELLVVDEEGEAVAATEEDPLEGVERHRRRGEALAWDAIRGIQRGIEEDVGKVVGEEAEQWGLAVVGAEAAEELGGRRGGGASA